MGSKIQYSFIYKFFPIVEIQENLLEFLIIWISSKRGFISHLYKLVDVYKAEVGWCASYKVLPKLEEGSLIIEIIIIFPFRSIGNLFRVNQEENRVTESLQVISPWGVASSEMIGRGELNRAWKGCRELRHVESAHEVRLWDAKVNDPNLVLVDSEVVRLHISMADAALMESL